MKRFTYFIALAVILYLSGGLALAQHGHAPGGAIGGPGAAGGPRTHGDVGNGGTGSSPVGTGPQTASSQLTNNQHLDTALTKALGTLVPSGGLSAACQGYLHLGQCISAIHVANNRNLDFYCLRKAMTGTLLPNTDTTACNVTQTNLKLGPAIQALDPSADPKVEAAKGTKQANADIHTASHGQS